MPRLNDLLAKMNEMDRAIEVISKIRPEFEFVLTYLDKDYPSQDDLRSVSLGVERIEVLDRTIPDFIVLNKQVARLLDGNLSLNNADAFAGG